MTRASTPQPVTRDELEAVARHAGPHRTIEYRFERDPRTRRLVCVGAFIRANRNGRQVA